MTNCKVCHAILHSRREHCHVCGTVVILFTIDALGEEGPSRTIEGKTIAPAHGCSRIYANPYQDKIAGKRYMIGD